MNCIIARQICGAAHCVWVNSRLKAVNEKLKHVALLRAFYFSGMKTKRSINALVILMSVALTVLIAVQYVWLSSAYKVKSEEFDRQTLNAMRATALALEEKNTLRYLAGKMKGDSLLANKWAREDSGFVDFVERAVGTESGAEEVRRQEVRTIVRIEREGGGQKVVVHTHSHKGEEENVETNIEYTVAEPPSPLALPEPPAPVGPAEEKRDKFISIMCQAADEYAAGENNFSALPDSVLLLKAIQQQFAKLQLPSDFSFAVLRAPGDSLLLAGNRNYTGKDFTYKTELLGFNFGDKGLWLLIDFPSRFKYVFLSLAGMFALSVLFSAVIIVVFVMALRLILKQKKLNEITNDFINNMTHEFKTPLATISMTADTLNLDNVSRESDRVKEYANMIKDEARNLSRHVDRILEAAAGNNEKNKATAITDLTEAVKNQLQLHENVFAGHKVKLQMHLPDAPLRVYAEQENLGYVISNLLDNAVKYSKTEPEITLTLLAKGATALLSIEDKGIGISKEERAMIFEKFFRAHTGNRHDVKGFGLGLSFVKNTVEAWGGKVWVESELGKGSRFFVELKTAQA